ncbi:MAG TPA: rhomboid family intramembrane serine protease [Luteolibacter sp.]|nr:rhomboid family intramembrane serine protease [Luteolibacter sp.]
MNPPPENDAHEPEVYEDLAEVGRYADPAEAHEHGLVILAMREPYWLMPADETGRYPLLAEADAAAGISREIEAYEEEKSTAPAMRREVEEVFRHSPAWSLCALWTALLIGVFAWQMADPGLVERAASSSTDLIGKKELWRPFTALFLHADVPHLVGNLVSGTIFGTLLSRLIGGWRAWLMILVCGTLGNAIVSTVAWPESFVSIGASTAVFGALGILCGLAFAALLREGTRLPWARTTAPVVAGIVLLGWLGGGGVDSNTDVLGHVFGFASGLAAGTAGGFVSRRAQGGDTRSHVGLRS